MTCKADNYDIDLLCRLSYIQIFLKNDNFFLSIFSSVKPSPHFCVTFLSRELSQQLNRFLFEKIF